jgi:hypothetical protein
MRQLTFEGYLKRFLSERSNCKSNSLKKLSAEAAGCNPQLREALVLYAFFVYSRESVFRLFRCWPGLIQEYESLFSEYGSICALLEAFQYEYYGLPERYQCVYNDYLHQKNRKHTEYDIKSLIKRKILILKKEKCITDYRLYTNLRINPGNFNAFMKHDRFDKLSLENVQRMLDYLENMPSKNHINQLVQSVKQA